MGKIVPHAGRRGNGRLLPAGQACYPREFALRRYVGWDSLRSAHPTICRPSTTPHLPFDRPMTALAASKTAPEKPRAKPHREDISPGEVLCKYCPAKCCHYFALPIDKPTTWKDFDSVRWFLMHDRASVFTDEGTWYLLVHTSCRHLQADNLCAHLSHPPADLPGVLDDQLRIRGQLGVRSIFRNARADRGVRGSDVGSAARPQVSESRPTTQRIAPRTLKASATTRRR